MEKTDENKQIHTPFELFGVECRKGWYKLIEPIFKYIEDYNKDKENDNDKIVVLQCKEKWGGLIIYTNFGTDELHKMIDDAEEKSYGICEDCGSETDVGMRITGWYTTMCLDCLKKEIQERGYPQRWERNSDNKLFWVNVDGTMEEIDKKDLP